MPVFDGAEMQVAEMRAVVVLVTNQVFPVSPLPCPRSPRARLTAEHRSVAGKPFEKSALIERQRVAKSVSDGGNSDTQCM